MKVPVDTSSSRTKSVSGSVKSAPGTVPRVILKSGECLLQSGRFRRERHVDLASYADLVIELVNTQDPAEDSLKDLDSLRELLTIRPHLSGRLTRDTLQAMRELRAEMRSIFVAAASGDEATAIDRLNTLLIQHPIHPQMSNHDGQNWHIHL